MHGMDIEVFLSSKSATVDSMSDECKLGVITMQFTRVAGIRGQLDVFHIDLVESRSDPSQLFYYFIIQN
jgi:hypothetical protein